jgi:H+/Cl- antiporter ClcA
VGGCIIIALTYIVGTTDYLGLGVTSDNPHGISIVHAFMFDDLSHWAWLLKLLFTAITLSAGFKGGEVTPLFFVGAMLGNALAAWLHMPVDLFAGIGFIAVFAGAANTPLACTIMGVELFGGTYILYFAIACFTAYFFSGHSGIYSSQQIGVAKITDDRFADETAVRQSIKRRIKFTEQLMKEWKNKQKKA